MAWSSPITWSASLVTVAQFNAQIRDNLNALKNPPTAYYTFNTASNYSTTSTTFVDVDATDLALTIDTSGGDVMIGFIGTFTTSSGTPRLYFDVAVDGVRNGGDDGICRMDCLSTSSVSASFVWLIEALSAGSHTFKLQWRTSSGTATLYAGAGTANADLHGQFWARELS